jgi:hypothetical protein
MDFSKLPDEPIEAAKLMLVALERVKAELNAGTFAEWGTLSNGKDGYVISKKSEEDIFATMPRGVPFVKYKIFPLLAVDQSIEALQKAVEERRPAGRPHARVVP